MNKDEAKEWMVEEKLAENEFSAGKIWKGLELWKADEGEQKRLVKTYRKLRTISKNTKLCFAYALEGLEFPKEYEPKEEPKKIDREKTLKELGF